MDEEQVVEEQEIELTLEQKNVLSKIATEIAVNEAAEAEAIKGYEVQRDMIQNAMAAFGDIPVIKTFLEELLKATDEKMRDELNHAHSLLREFTEITGVTPAED